jgi:dipeptidyl aminopeptidase/acylaminoacyl peptidase
MEKQAFAFGEWPSPISAAAVAEGALRFGRVQIFDGAVYWSESRPAEKGRSAVVRWTKDGGVAEILPAPYSARSRVHEYGGGEFTIADGRLLFVNDDDQNIYEAVLSPGGDIRRLTDLRDTRFADFASDDGRRRLISVGETHDPKHRHLPRNALWTIPTGQSREKPALLLAGRDFYANPRLSPDGSRLAFLAWNLPDMPWDAAQLFVADAADDGSLGEPVSVAGGNGSACFQPRWGKDGELYFVWDPDGHGNLFRWREGEKATQITHLDAELSMPLWSFNAASYALNEDRVYLAFTRNGETGAALYDLPSQECMPHNNDLSTVSTLSAGEESVALVGMRDDEPLCIALDAVAQPGRPLVIRRSSSLHFDEEFVAKPTRIEIPGVRGAVHGLLYPPMNPVAEGPAGELPPLIVSLHGGPTSAASRGLKPKTLFFTSRGFSWLDLDYSGSTGYGRAYRDRLKGNWGVADVDDTISAAEFVASSRLADRNAIFVTGGSAGGYTVLMAIAAADIFRGAASYYGICDLVALQKTTHKFEQGYQSTLLGAGLEDGEDIYRERSAIHHVDRMKTPLILFQGADDNVVPKDQSSAIAAALRAKGILVEYHEFAGEGHGFRKAETIRTCLERELAFYRMLLGSHDGAQGQS